jgi:small subunit ribosomal protein S6
VQNVRQYELVYIVPPDTTEEQLADVHKQVAVVVERFGGTIERTEPCGRRKLAYEIAHQREGQYVLEVINAPGTVTAELDRRLRTIDTVIRHMVVRVDEELAVAERARSRRKERTTARRVRRGLPPEPTETELNRRREESDDMDVMMDAGFRGGRERD